MDTQDMLECLCDARKYSMLRDGGIEKNVGVLVELLGALVDVRISELEITTG